MKKAVPLLLCASLVMPAGCANIQDDGTRTKTEGALVGAAAGAGIGAIIGELTGSAAIGALIGGGIGALGGLFVGSHIADSKADYASREDWLDACIADAQETNSKLVAINNELKAEIAALDKKSAELAAAYKRKEVNARTMQNEHKVLVERQKEVDQLIASLQDEVKIQHTVVADAKDGNNNREAGIIEHEITKMEKQIAELREESNKLASLSSRISI